MYFLDFFLLSFIMTIILCTCSWSGYILSFNSLIIIDNVSLVMCILTVWLIRLSGYSTPGGQKNDLHKQFFFFLKIIIIFLLFRFFFLDFFFFFFFFEARILFLLYKILGWGYQVDRLRAGFYMVIYAVFGTFPLLCFIIYYSKECGFTSIIFRVYWGFGGGRLYLTILCMLRFLIKFPLYVFHIWLPKAHVEASTCASIILAGVLLKLGGYGFYRFQCLLIRTKKILLVVYFFSLMGRLVIIFVCINSKDIKYLIACSSVVHMGLCIRGLLFLSFRGFWGALLIIVGHGACSSCLFFLAGSAYNRIGRRSLWLLKGGFSIRPGLSICWFLRNICNITIPPRINLAGEIYIITRALNQSFFLCLLLIIVIIGCCLYRIWLYSVLGNGKNILTRLGTSGGLFVEYTTVFFHLSVIFAFIFMLSDFYIN